MACLFYSIRNVLCGLGEFNYVNVIFFFRVNCLQSRSVRISTQRTNIDDEKKNKTIRTTANVSSPRIRYKLPLPFIVAKNNCRINNEMYFVSLGVVWRMSVRECATTICVLFLRFGNFIWSNIANEINLTQTLYYQAKKVKKMATEGESETNPERYKKMHMWLGL